MATLLDALVVLIEKGPGRTEIALADAIGNRALEDQVSVECPDDWLPKAELNVAGPGACLTHTGIIAAN